MLATDLVPLFEHYPQLSGATLRPLPGGLINLSLLVGDDFVLQRLHPIFDERVNLDIGALGPVLRAAGVPVPALLPTGTGAFSVRLQGHEAADGVWRLLSRLPGRSVERVQSPQQLEGAARGLAAFHVALREVEHDFAFARLGIHDTPAHISKLQITLAEHPQHRLYAACVPVVEKILEQWQAFPAVPPLPRRIGHGDPKLSNFLFDEDDALTGVIDLDTMGWTTLDAELGDALRSWCSSTGESANSPRFDSEKFERALRAYLAIARVGLVDAELEALARAPERIALELASRFAADALRESYFGWDPQIAPSRGEHNLLRAQNQLALARDVARQRSLLEQIVGGLG